MGNSLSPENFFVSYQKKRYPVHVIAAKLPEKNAEESIKTKSFMPAFCRVLFLKLAPMWIPPCMGYCIKKIQAKDSTGQER